MALKARQGYIKALQRRLRDEPSGDQHTPEISSQLRSSVFGLTRMLSDHRYALAPDLGRPRPSLSLSALPQSEDEGKKYSNSNQMTPSGDEYESESSDESESVFSTTPPQVPPSPLDVGYERYLLRGCTEQK